MARPTKYVPHTAGFICRAVGLGVTLPAAAVMAGVSVSTLYQWRKQMPEFAAALNRAKAGRSAPTFAGGADGGR